MTADQCFVLDLVVLLREKATETKKLSEDGGEYEKGRNFAYYEVLSLIYQQATAFNINLEDIGMEDFDPDLELL